MYGDYRDARQFQGSKKKGRRKAFLEREAKRTEKQLFLQKMQEDPLSLLKKPNRKLIAV